MDDEIPADLVHALERAAELEHAVLLQYLFAAASLRRRPGPGLGLLQLERIRGWERTLLAIAREEMAHLAAVSNLLIAVGAAPWLVRPGLPGGRLGRARSPLAGADSPPGGDDREALVLERFGPRSLARFIGLERQEAGAARVDGAAAGPGAGEGVNVETGAGVGTISGHYASIKGEIGRLAAEGQAVVREPALDVVDGWRISGAAHFPAVTDAASALEVIDAIVGQGAGLGAEDPDSHLARLLTIEAELGREDAGLDPAQQVVSDPILAPAAGAGSGEAAGAGAGPGRGEGDGDGDGEGTLVSDPRTVVVAGAFAAVYQAMTLLLELYHPLLAAGPRAAVGARRVAQGLMTGVLRPLGEVLAELPVGEAAPGWSCGPTFAWDPGIRLGEDRRESWALLGGMLAGAAAGLGAVAGDGGPPRLAALAENVGLASRLVAATGGLDI
ncbi:MAG: hypothetical protein QOF77_1615 [Solirubrobacteraceae bacterium]|jgi:hypothetical protein|nr:hypothetical protein [Solirubrobacteraceae bacterium]